MKLTEYLYSYAKEKKIYILKLFVNADHVHILLDLPTNITIEEIAHLLKGSSSNWLNKSNLLATKFSWGRGYGAFSVSQSSVQKVCKYITNQEEHHRVKSFSEEYEKFIKKYEINKTVETVPS